MELAAYQALLRMKNYVILSVLKAFQCMFSAPKCWLLIFLQAKENLQYIETIVSDIFPCDT